ARARRGAQAAVTAAQPARSALRGVKDRCSKRKSVEKKDWGWCRRLGRRQTFARSKGRRARPSPSRRREFAGSLNPFWPSRETSEKVEFMSGHLPVLTV